MATDGLATVGLPNTIMPICGMEEWEPLCGMTHMNPIKFRLLINHMKVYLVFYFGITNTDHQFIVFSCYLPHENSPWGRNNEGFLVSQIYLHNYVGLYFLCGDINGCIGNLDDFARNIDDLSNWDKIDSSKNKHGEALIDFLLETKMCITNGRISRELKFMGTGFTSKGKSVVDYIIVPHDFIPNCIKCEIQSTDDLIDKYGLLRLLGAICKPPDHALITLTCSVYSSMMTDRGGVKTKNCMNKRYYFDVIPEQFMSSPYWHRIIDELLEKVQNMDDTIPEVDSVYSELCNAILSEMDAHIRYSSNDKKTHKK